MSAPWTGRLGSLVRVRRIREDLAAAELRLAASKRADVLRELAALSASLERTDLPEPFALTGEARGAWVDLASAELERLRLALVAAEADLADKETSWLSAMRRREAAERLIERRRQAWLADAGRAEQKLLDEVAEHRWSDRARKGARV